MKNFSMVPSRLRRVIRLLQRTNRELTEAMADLQSFHACVQPDEGSAEPDPRLRLAYDAAVETLSIQDRTLGNLRNRATTLLTLASILTTFSAALGVINIDPSRGPVFPKLASLTLFGVLICIAVLVMVILWPARKWGYNPDPGTILNEIDKRNSEDAIRRFVVEKSIEKIKDNREKIAIRYLCYRGAVLLLIAEMLILLATVTAR